MKHQLFLLNLGYAECTRISTMMILHQSGFDEVLEAMESLRTLLVEFIKNQYSVTESEINDKVSEILNELHNGDIDSISDMGLWDHLEDAGWLLSSVDLEHFKMFNPVFVDRLEQWMRSGGKNHDYLYWAFLDENGHRQSGQDKPNLINHLGS